MLYQAQLDFSNVGPLNLGFVASPPKLKLNFVLFFEEKMNQAN